MLQMILVPPFFFLFFEVLHHNQSTHLIISVEFNLADHPVLDKSIVVISANKIFPKSLSRSLNSYTLFILLLMKVILAWIISLACLCL